MREDPEHYRRDRRGRQAWLRSTRHRASLSLGSEWAADADANAIDSRAAAVVRQRAPWRRLGPCRRPENLPRLVLVTRGAQAIGSDAHEVAPGAGIALGLSRSIAREHPELRCTAVDLTRAAPAPRLASMLS